MNYKKLIIVFIITFFLNANLVYADTYKVTITGNAVSIRTGAGTNYSKIDSVSSGNVYTAIDNTLYSGTGCSDGWYYIKYNDSNGYVCSTYANLTVVSNSDTATTECEIEMQNAGFPSSYWSSLCSLKESHPTWSFVALETNVSWSYAVEKQSTCGRSYIQTTNSDYIDTSCTNQYGSSSSWKNASQTAVAYYMDPRNWLSEKYIFQFEYLQYSDTLANYYESSVTSILGSASVYTYHTSIGNNLSSLITSAGKNTNVSPTFLASRILQELGSSNTLYNLYSGVYTEYDNAYYGYYNFYNYGVTDSCATTYGSSYCGLSAAKSYGWYGISTALEGGASKLSANYISVGQYTTYLQKYNVVNGNYSHQYMTNIAAPSSEAYTTYKTYSSLGLLDLNYVFYIPVYEDMDSTITNTSSGATASDDTSTGSTLAISTIVTSSGYTYSTGYISGIEVGTDISTVVSNISSVGGSNSAIGYDSSGNVKSSGTIQTGDKILVTNSTSTETLEVVIKGDTSGDGVINALDLLQVQKNILGTYTLTGPYLLAGDTSGDSMVNALDLLQVQKNILGTYTIEQ